VVTIAFPEIGELVNPVRMVESSGGEDQPACVARTACGLSSRVGRQKRR
jgi:hypothetical protein